MHGFVGLSQSWNRSNGTQGERKPKARPVHFARGRAVSARDLADAAFVLLEIRD